MLSNLRLAVNQICVKDNHVSIHQSINQSVRQSVNQLINQSNISCAHKGQL